MKKLQKSIRAIAEVMLMGTVFSLTSCDVMLDVLGGMSSGMAYYSPYGYTSSFGVSTNNNYLLDPNYAMWQANQQMEEMNRVNQQLIETSTWQVEHGIYLGGTSGTEETGGNVAPNPSTTKTHTCGLCGGSGKTVKTDGISFGNTKYCSECGKTVPDSHYHSNCESCGGKGWW